MKLKGIMICLCLVLVDFTSGQDDTCETLSCGNDGPSQNGQCGEKKEIAWWCTDSSAYCKNSAIAKNCYCCVEKCRDISCEADGGRCFDKKQEGMECEQNTDKCRSIPKPQIEGNDGFPVGSTVPCWCCKKIQDPEPVPCVDKGCASSWQGQGQCVNATSVPWTQIEAEYDLRYTNPYYNKRCVAANGDKDCCLCMRKRPCRDDGCYAQGGMCVDLKNSRLGNPNSYPTNAVDLGSRIDGDLCKSKPTSTTDAKKCCECFKRKED